MNKERWATITEFEDYKVSSYGRVRRVRITCPGTKRHILKPYANIVQGYLEVNLYKGKGTRDYRHAKVHHLVLEAFVSPRPHKHECNHKDGNRANARLDNLEWVTKSQNRLHQARVLRSAVGATHGMAKLDDDRVRQIRKLLASGLTQQKVALQMGVSRSAILKINLGKTWSHVE